MIYFWNSHGGDMRFDCLDKALKRAKYRGMSGTKGVSMWDIDGVRYFTKDMPL